MAFLSAASSPLLRCHPIGASLRLAFLGAPITTRTRTMLASIHLRLDSGKGHPRTCSPCRPFSCRTTTLTFYGRWPADHLVLSSHIFQSSACIAHYVYDDHARSHTPPSAEIPKGFLVAWSQSCGPMSHLHLSCCSLADPCVRLPSWWHCLEGHSSNIPDGAQRRVSNRGGIGHRGMGLLTCLLVSCGARLTLELRDDR